MAKGCHENRITVPPPFKGEGGSKSPDKQPTTPVRCHENRITVPSPFKGEGQGEGNGIGLPELSIPNPSPLSGGERASKPGQKVV